MLDEMLDAFELALKVTEQREGRCFAIFIVDNKRGFFSSMVFSSQILLNFFYRFVTSGAPCTSKLCRKKDFKTSESLLKVSYVSGRTLENQKLLITPFMTLPSNSKEDCTKECLNNDTCFSINLYMVSGQGTCELLQSNAFVNKSLLTDERIGWTYISFDVSDIELLRNRILIFMQLTHFMPLVSFYTF